MVPHTWPNVRNAEYEVLQRIARAATNIGAVMIAIDNDGYPLWANNSQLLDKNKQLDPSDIDFMISLHFESPRLLDVYSYYALWQPLDFYDTFGFDRTSEQVLSHTDALSCRSEVADLHAKNLFDGARAAEGGVFPVLFHSPPKPYYEPIALQDPKLFYVGINWERINSERGRHQDLLERLDAESLIDIYGPRNFLGVEPWRGFSCYRGELPFDGQSVVRAINKSGVCLALSSEAHQKSALMSNRLFEGLAAGAAIIANRNGFIDRYFSDIVHIIDDKVSSDDLFFQVTEALDKICTDPAATRAKAIEGQKRLEELFSLEGCLTAIIEGHPEKQRCYQQSFLSSATATVVVIYPGESLSEVEECLRDAISQTSVKIAIVLVCDDSFRAHHADHLSALVAADGIDFEIVSGRFASQYGENDGAKKFAPPDLTGPIVYKALQRIRTDYFAFLRPGERWFRDHVAGIAKAIELSPAAVFGMSGALDESSSYVSGRLKSHRTLKTVRFHEDKGFFVYDDGPMDVGRFVFRTDIVKSLPAPCCRLLSGEEPYLVRAVAALKGELAQSGFASFVRLVSHPARFSSPEVKLDHQRRYIRDALATHLGRVVKPQRVEPSESRSPATRQGDGNARSLALGTIVDVRTNGLGLQYLTAGFSQPEKEFVWADGETASFAFDVINPAGFAFQDLDLLIELAGRDRYGDKRPQHCSIIVNGVSVAYAEISESERTFKFRLPKGLISRGILNCQIAADHAEQVLNDAGQVADPRRLGFRVHRLGLMPSPFASNAEANLATRYEFGVRGNGQKFIDEGFYKPDDDCVWMGNGPARLRFRLKAGAEFGRLRLNLAGIENRSDGSAQELTVILNDQKLGVLVLDKDFREYSLPVPQELAAHTTGYNLFLASKHASAIFDRSGRVIDQRILSVALSSMQIEGIGRIEYGSIVSFGELGTGNKYVAGGFSDPEPGYTWIDGISGQLQFVLDINASDDPLELVCVLGGRDLSTGPTNCKVILNKALIGTASLSENAKEFRFRIPDADLETGALWSLEFAVDRAEPVRNANGMVIDPRLLAIRVHSISVSKTRSIGARLAQAIIK